MTDREDKLLGRRLVLIGMKASGKTTVGRALAERLAIPFVDVDAEIEAAYTRQTGEQRPFRTIFQAHGRGYFRQLEQETLRHLSQTLPERCVLATGGGLPLDPLNRELLRPLGTIIFLDVAEETLLDRITADGIPAFFPYPAESARSLRELLVERRPHYAAAADLTIPIATQTTADIVETIAQSLPPAL